MHNANIQYLGGVFCEFQSFRRSLDAAKRGFHPAANSIFGKVGRVASKKAVIQLTFTKCMPILLYGLEAYVLNKSDIRSLDFVLNRFRMKLF